MQNYLIFTVWQLNLCGPLAATLINKNLEICVQAFRWPNIITLQKKMGANLNELPTLTVIDIRKQTDISVASYTNFPVALVNDHVVRVSIMTEPYFWHLHPNSD